MLEVFARLSGNARLNEHFKQDGKEWQPVSQAAMHAMKRDVTGSMM